MTKHVVQCTASGEQHGLVNVLPNSVPFDDFKNIDPKIKADCEKQKKEDAKLVKVKYRNMRGNHERLDKSYCRWAGDMIQQYHLIPGYSYEVPLGMVKEVNQTKMPQRSGLMNVDGKDITRDGSPLAQDTPGEQIHMLYSDTF